MKKSIFLITMLIIVMTITIFSCDTDCAAADSTTPTSPQFIQEISFDGNGADGGTVKHTIYTPIGNGYDIIIFESKPMDYKAIEIKSIPTNEFTKKGYVFYAWSTSPDGSGKLFFDRQEWKPTSTKAHITLYAQWASDGLIYTPTYSSALTCDVSKETFDGKDLVIPPYDPYNHRYVTSIKDHAFEACTKLNTTSIPNSVSQIGSYAFAYSGLSNITLPNSINQIGSYAFAETRLSNITLPNSITQIEDYTFDSCTELNTINIPNSVSKIGSHAFYKCSSLSNITLPNSIKQIEDYTFYYCTELDTINIPNSVSKIGSYAFYKCTSLSNITLPDTINEIEDEAFLNCENLGTINLKNVKIIGKEAFRNCSLKNITLCDELTTISEEAFRDAKTENLILPANLTTINDRAFYCCRIKEIIIPKDVTTIGNSAFAECQKLQSITFQSETPPTDIHPHFLYQSNIKNIFVPASAVEAYKNLAAFDTILEGDIKIKDLVKPIQN